MSKAVLRALAHSVVAVATLLLFAWIARLLGAGDGLAAAIGLAVSLAPGAYDYLGRDLLGRRIGDDDPLEDLSYLWIGKTRYERDLDTPLNGSDFIYLASELSEEWAYLSPMIQGLTLQDWRGLDPESDIAAAVLSSVEAKIDAISDWAIGRELPMIGLFYADIHALLLAELARDFDAAMVAPIRKSSVQ